MAETIPKSTRSIILDQPPVTNVVTDLSSPDSTFKLVENKIGTLQENEVLVKVLYLSNDPTQRGWIQKDVDPARSYVPPVFKGQVMRSVGVGKIVESKSTKYSKGDLVVGLLSWEEYAAISHDRIFNKVEDTSIPLTTYLDVLGLTGLTAYFGISEVGKLAKDQTIVISAAAGATGSMCVQLAKKLFGAKKVIAITGSDSKCEYVKSIGADVALNHNNSQFESELRTVIGEEFVDVYFDCVGGRVLSIMLSLVKPFGRVVACGSIAGYNDSELMKVSNWGEIIKNRLTVQGFIVSDFRPKFMEAIIAISGGIKKGDIKYDQNSFSLFDLTKEGDFSKIPEVWNLLFSEKKNPGKLLTKISDL